jgi:hypothetical protein
VADEYFAVSEKVEALYDVPKNLPAGAEGDQMHKLRAEMHQRMPGNGYCARPVGLDYHFESICESCTFFRHHRVPPHPPDSPGRRRRQEPDRPAEIFDGLLARLQESPLMTRRPLRPTQPGELPAPLLDEFSTSVVTEAAGALAALRTPNWLGDSAVSLYALASLIAQAQQMVPPQAVSQARDQGHAWAGIVRLLNLSLLAAVRRYRHLNGQAW